MTLLLATLWGGAVGLDATAAFQFMISRPLVAATVTGLLVGRPAEAAMIGIVLEIFSLVILPVGAVRYPESGTGAIVAAFAYGQVAGPVLAPAILLLAVVFGLAWERVAGLSVVALRQANGWILAGAPTRAVLGARRLERLHLMALGLDGARAAMLVLIGAPLGGWILARLGPYWSLDGDLTLRVIAVAAATMLGASLSLFSGGKRRRLVFALGIICGSILLLIR